MHLKSLRRNISCKLACKLSLESSIGIHKSKWNISLLKYFFFWYFVLVLDNTFAAEINSKKSLLWFIAFKQQPTLTHCVLLKVANMCRFEVNKSKASALDIMLKDS